MSTVQVVLTDTRLWARSESTHWDGPPSIVPGGTGASFVIGEPLRPPSPAVSVVRLAAADRIVFGAWPDRTQAPQLTDAMAILFGAVLENLRLPDPVERLTVLCPSEWGRRRRAVLEAAARRLVTQVFFEPIAMRAAALSGSTSQQQRIVVLEVSPVSTTATLVGRSGRDVWIEACEHEPTVGAADVEATGGLDALAEPIIRVLGTRTPSYVLVLGISDPLPLATVLAQRFGGPVDVRLLSGEDLIRTAGGPAVALADRPVATPAAEWAGSLRQRAVVDRPPRRRPGLRLAVATTAMLVLAAAVTGFVLWDRPATRSVPAASPPASTPAAPSGAAPAEYDFGRVRVRLPRGWYPSTTSAGRLELLPGDSARERLTLTQQALTPGAGIDDVAATLDARIKDRPAGTVGELRRDVVFGGRTGLSYEEHPADGSIVRWQVLAESGLQVSIGCQYQAAGWQAVAQVCEDTVRDLRISG